MRIPLLLRLFQSKDDLRNYFYPSPCSFFFGSTSSGKTVNERTAMQTKDVYACVGIPAETIASLPLNTYRHTDKGKGNS